jgi:hypothetical protein
MRELSRVIDVLPNRLVADTVMLNQAIASLEPLINSMKYREQ